LPINNLIYHQLLAPGALSWAGYPSTDLSHLRFITFIGVIAALVQVVELVLELLPAPAGSARHFPALAHGQLRDPWCIVADGAARV
jgi:Na+-transporting NADH:ubiquinone oxidoreductase subunit NqrE